MTTCLEASMWVCGKHVLCPETSLVLCNFHEAALCGPVFMCAFFAREQIHENIHRLITSIPHEGNLETHTPHNAGCRLTGRLQADGHPGLVL